MKYPSQLTSLPILAFLVFEGAACAASANAPAQAPEPARTTSSVVVLPSIGDPPEPVSSTAFAANDDKALGPQVTGSGADVRPLKDGEVAKLVASANDAEVEQGRYAARHAVNARVREFAQHMITAHGGANEQMSAMMDNEVIVPIESLQSSTLVEQAQQTFEQLRSKSSSDFDKAYVDAQVNEHKDAIELFDHVLAVRTRNPAMRSMLESMRATASGHLREAQDLQRSLVSGQIHGS